MEMENRYRDAAQTSAVGLPPRPMPPPPARTPLAREEVHEADPRAHSLIAMHVAVAPRTPSTVVFFGVDASRASTCIALPTAQRIGARWDADGRSVVYINGQKRLAQVLSAAESAVYRDTLGADVLQHHGDAADPELADPVALLML
ncbi:hypothetical protein pqer_cds_241 [Pandoravirus quercus]|uniref:Uncharacterized protein n=1 Tax=Pandoravirus quercus TaxID=2107709 RepID=A0A2U7U8A8_9VIRU|nr:hypothetical protein pqer_cds_241 [Pandoravirus quercus]AVK74663.1 hypothetical protein pqer_cds_241 [Pandoravirus quercus]